MQALPEALAPLSAYRQFIVYLLVPSKTRPGKSDKFPVDFRTGRMPMKGGGGAHDVSIWTDAHTAMGVAAQLGASYGVGFVFTEADPFFFLDIDHAYADGQWSQVAQGLCGALAGAGVEVSQSLTGLHIIGRYTGSMPPHGCKNEAYGLELYHSGRFVALTGINAAGSVSYDCSHILPALIAAYFPSTLGVDDEQGWTDGPVEGWRGPSDDADLLRRALASKSAAAAFGGRASFADLWTGNLEALARAFPAEGRPYDASSADAALAQHLAFWTGNDCERIARMMQGSALNRDKWIRDDYLPRTIRGAVSRQSDVLTDKEPEPVAPPTTELEPDTVVPSTPMVTEGSNFLAPPAQMEMFNGCVYVSDSHRMLVPGGRLLRPEQFKVHFGGYTFMMDNANERTSRDAWEAYTQNSAYRCPKADGACFKPNRPPGEIIVRGGQSLVNTYVDVKVPRKVGDATPFDLHLRKLYPNEHDRLVILYYMAACVQHKGYKFQWAPILQGVEGNGKTLLSRCVAEAIGARYVHWPKASKLAKEFNGWMVGKIFYAVEDIYVADNRREVIEELKPMITGGDGLEIESKGVDQVSADICGNFMLNSNHKDAIRKTKNDRRFANLFSAQQDADDLKRDGMTGDYFPNIYKWLRAEGFAIVSELLHTLPIPDEFNPATGCQRAPITSSTQEAIEASAGGVEQEIQEAIEQGQPGFAGGWISSIMLDRLLERIGTARRLTHSKRKEMLYQMGYIYHPALHDGRVNNQVLPDQGKPRLYVKAGSPAALITGAVDACKAYESLNNFTRGLPFPVRT